VASTAATFDEQCLHSPWTCPKGVTCQPVSAGSGQNEHATLTLNSVSNTRDLAFTTAASYPESPIDARFAGPYFRSEDLPTYSAYTRRLDLLTSRTTGVGAMCGNFQF